MRHRLVILDRDGVINEERLDYIRSVDQWRPLPGSLEAIARLCRAGLAVAVATNQSGVGRGYLTADELDAIHTRMEAAVGNAGGELAGVFHCPHTPEDRCRCRKPLPGLLEQIQAAVGLPVTGEYMVGDSMRDLEAASAAGARPALVRTGFGAATELRLPPGGTVPVFADLAEFTRWLLRSAE